MILTLDCEGSAKLTCESMDRPLSRAERIAVSAHRLVCSKSRRLNHQLLELNAKLNHQPMPENCPLPGLSEAARRRIESRLGDLKLDSDSAT